MRASLIVNFTSATLTGSPGNTLTFGGTLDNETGSPVYINDASLDLVGFSDPSTYDVADYLLVNAPLTAVPNGQSLGPFSFFTVTIPLGFSNGSYAGTLFVQGGATRTTMRCWGPDFHRKRWAAKRSPGTALLASGGDGAGRVGACCAVCACEEPRIGRECSEVTQSQGWVDTGGRPRCCWPSMQPNDTTRVATIRD